MKLKKCPNVKCKCEAKIIIDKTFTGTVGYRVKSDCGIESGWFKTKQQAIDSWNTRPESGVEKFWKWKSICKGKPYRHTILKKLKELLNEENE